MCTKIVPYLHKPKYKLVIEYGVAQFVPNSTIRKYSFTFSTTFFRNDAKIAQNNCIQCHIRPLLFQPYSSTSFMDRFYF